MLAILFALEILIFPDYLNTVMNMSDYHNWCYNVKRMLLINLISISKFAINDTYST